jgi:tricorn protease-like protein
LSVALHADGRRAVTGSWDKTVRVWDLHTGACLRTLEGHTGPVYLVALHADGQCAVTGSYDGTVRVWDLHTGACLRTLDGVIRVALHADGRRAVTKGVGRPWGNSYGRLSRTEGLARKASRSIRALSRTRVQVWDLDTGACLRTLKVHTGSVESVAFHADGRRAVTGGSRRTRRCGCGTWTLGRA